MKTGQLRHMHLKVQQLDRQHFPHLERAIKSVESSTGISAGIESLVINRCQKLAERGCDNREEASLTPHVAALTAYRSFSLSNTKTLCLKSYRKDKSHYSRMF